jgi:hypothetical protein
MLPSGMHLRTYRLSDQLAHSQVRGQSYHLRTEKEDSLRHIRVLLARMPRMLLDILSHVVASEPDMVVVGWVKDDEDLLAATRRARANVILVGQAVEDEQEKYASLLWARPRLKVVAIAGDGKTGLLYELRPQRVPLGEISADALRNAIRGQPRSTTAAVP